MLLNSFKHLTQRFLTKSETVTFQFSSNKRTRSHNFHVIMWYPSNTNVADFAHN